MNSEQCTGTIVRYNFSVQFAVHNIQCIGENMHYIVHSVQWPEFARPGPQRIVLGISI